MEDSDMSNEEFSYCTPACIMVEESDSSNEDPSYCAPPELRLAATNDVVLPEKSRQRYELAYESFTKWQQEQVEPLSNVFSENVLLAYFEELSSTKSPATLWSFYSMLKSVIKLKNNVDISKYKSLLLFLKNKSKNYTPVKAKVFTDEEVSKFIHSAPDQVYLATKAVLIFGLLGAMRTDELVSMSIENVERYETPNRMYLVKIPKNRSFIINDEYFDIIEKYIKLRPANLESTRFFLNYQKGKCTKQAIGKNKFSSMSREIAKYLNLKNADRYTGHSFRKTSTTILANNRADVSSIKRHNAWKSTNMTERYIEDSVHYNEKNIGEENTRVFNHLCTTPSDMNKHNKILEKKIQKEYTKALEHGKTQAGKLTQEDLVRKSLQLKHAIEATLKLIQGENNLNSISFELQIIRQIRSLVLQAEVVTELLAEMES